VGLEGNVNWILSIVGLIVALLLSLLALELGTRCWLRRKDRYYVWLPNLRLEFHPDPEVFPELERKVRFEINSDGERGNEPPHSGAGVYRILVAGGSPAECALLDQSTSWPGVLEHILNKAENLRMFGASKIHVGNIGRSGTASAHLNITFQNVLPQYGHLDLVIIMVGGNDVWDWLQRGAPAVYTPSPAAITDTCFICPGRPFGWKLRVSALGQLLREIRMRWLHPVNVRHNTGRWVGKARSMRARAKEIRNSVPDPKDMLANFERNFRELLTTAKVHSGRVLVALQPWFEKNQYTLEEISHFWSGGMGDPYRGDEVTVFYSLEVCSQLMRLMNLRAVKVADELGVDYLNLMPLLEPSLKNYYDFIHFTPAGAAVAAEAIAETLLRSKRKPRSRRKPNPSTQLSEGPIDFQQS
jgi:lysophospholipase L1-like esterase